MFSALSSSLSESEYKSSRLTMRDPETSTRLAFLALKPVTGVSGDLGSNETEVFSDREGEAAVRSIFERVDDMTV